MESKYTYKNTDSLEVIRYYNSNYQLHRLDGPAIECPDGTSHWYLNDKYYDDKSYRKMPLIMFLNYCKSIR